MPASTTRTITLTASIGTDDLVHLDGQAGPGAGNRVHIHVHQPAQADKLRRYLATATGAGPTDAELVRLVRRAADAAGWRLHWDGASYTLDTAGLAERDRLPIHNLTLAQAAAVVAATGDGRPAAERG